MQVNFKGLIWTDHALSRLKQREIKQGDAWATWRHPDSSRYAESKGAWIYYKNFGKRKIEVVAKKNEKGEWLVLSVWDKLSDDSGRGETVLKRFFSKFF